MNTTAFAVHVSPNAKHNQLIGWREDVLWVKIAAPPVDNKANKMLIGFLASLLDVPLSALIIKSGESSRVKILSIEGLSKEDILKKLGTQLF